MAFTVHDYQDLVRLLRQRPEWQLELRHLLLDDDFLALPRIVSELAEAQRRTEAQVKELVEAQRRTVAQVEDLVEIQKRSEVRLGNLEKSVDQLKTDVGQPKGDSLQRKYAEYAPSYFGRWLRGIQVVLPGQLNVEVERRLTGALDEEELAQVYCLDLIARGELSKPADLAGQEIWLAAEISVTVDAEDVRRARTRAALLRKAGLRAVPVVARVGITHGAGEASLTPPVVVLLDGRAMGWTETVLALQDEMK